MTLSCPCCRATNDSGPSCRRCKADLSLVFAVAIRQRWLMGSARICLREGKFFEAMRLLEEAKRVRDTIEVRQLLASARLAQGEFAGAWAMYQSTSTTGAAS